MGSGIMLSKLPDGRWSGPASLVTFAANVDIQFGMRKTDTLLILPTWYHVRTFQRALDGFGQLKLGAAISIAVFA